MFIFFFFLILICTSLYIVYYFNNKLYTQKRQLIASKKQCAKLKNMLNNNKSYPSKITVNYLQPKFTTGTIKYSCSLKLSPLEHSSNLATIEAGTIVNIVDSAEISNRIWYEIYIPNIPRSNSKGWISSFYIE